MIHKYKTKIDKSDSVRSYLWERFTIAENVHVEKQKM